MLKQDEISSTTQPKNIDLLRQSANLIGLGILSQESGDYQLAKPLMKEGIDKIKDILLRDTTKNNKLILEYVSNPI